ncbi:unnamed protein product [Cylicostephanus goldi]|uniref:Uncharacterized protein n=1 Tax=Cylicostephanus goldi TaxID=71465 RepID=A0A3P6RXY7_CYLGO|nr:unnamed protein product [Cylicostephanus goldi]
MPDDFFTSGTDVTGATTAGLGVCLGRVAISTGVLREENDESADNDGIVSIVGSELEGPPVVGRVAASTGIGTVTVASECTSSVTVAEVVLVLGPSSAGSNLFSCVDRK